jgi:hypothetical protein
MVEMSRQLFKKGEEVWPSKTNPHKFNKNVKFPWKVNREVGLTLYIEHLSSSGKKVVEPWWIGYWQAGPNSEFKQKGAISKKKEAC